MVTDRARRVVQEPFRRRSTPTLLTTHSRAPAGPLRGPLRCQEGSPRSVGSTGIALPVPTPVYPPSIPTLPAPPRTHRARTTPYHRPRTWHSVFGTLVGEPRGIRTQVNSASEDHPEAELTVRLNYTAV